MNRTRALYPWFNFFRNLTFWQSIWFLYFQNELSPAAAITLYAVYDIATTALEVPSGYLSDRIGRRVSLLVSAVAGLAGALLIALGDSFASFAMAQVCLGASAAFVSGTDSALLYETLAAEGAEDAVETEELRAWRFSFAGLALSAVTGGAMALYGFALPFLATAIAFVVVLGIALAFREPPHRFFDPEGLTSRVRLASLWRALRQPVLLWLFVLSLLMYAYSHIPFVFGQPFILEALTGLGLAAEAPLVSGAVSSIMMVLSVVVSLYALRLRKAVGLAGILLLAFGIQIGLAAALAISDSVFVIALLFLRMVPDSLSRPFILARIQPLLEDETRATFLSLKSFCGRLFFASTLLWASQMTTGDGPMPHDDLQVILWVYAGFGLLCFAALLGAAQRVAIEPAD